uniref:Uncharacterized protein n=1 Tax=Arundo donax TaxID=35708 RepID=A0A0A9A5I6_ARUDO
MWTSLPVERDKGDNYTVEIDTSS